ncbi:MAG: choice-of-anchor I family protein [Eubacteriales bacterium]
MKKITGGLIALALMLLAGQTVFAQEGGEIPNENKNTAVGSYTDESADISGDPDALIMSSSEFSDEQLIIEHIYGGGGKGDTPISNSFVELYSLADTDIDLTEYTLSDGTYTLSLTGTIPANGSYLIIGAAEETTDEFLTYDLPQADQSCDWSINNKSYTISLIKDGDVVDSVTAGSSPATKISKQKSLKRTDNGDFELIVWEKTSVTVDEAYIVSNAPRNSKGEYGSVHTIKEEVVYTPAEAGDTRVVGYYNSEASLRLELAGRYNSGAMSEDGGSLEIVTYNPINGYAYAVSGVKGRLIAVDLNDRLDDEKVVNLAGTEYDVKTLVDGFAYGDMTSVSVSPDGSRLAVAIQAENYAENGVVALFACNTDGSLELLSAVRVGVQPDMLTFADNHTILTADEGEPREGSEAEDPKGSVTIIRIDSENVMKAESVYFDDFDEQRDELTSAGVLVQKGIAPSVDFEPEYIATVGNTAYVSLQEANAIAVLDIGSGVFTNVYPLGFQNYGETMVDLEKNDKIELKNYENVYGIKMPDGISAVEINGKTYLLTANEGDSRADWPGLDNEYEDKTSPTGNVTLDSKVVWFNANMWDGLSEDKAYVFGGRSFSIYEVTGDGLKLVFDSGSEFEQVTAEKLPDYFNASNNKTSPDNRSGKKGPEPESVITGMVDGKTYAFIAIERIGGVMVYDITDPENTAFVNYINSREFDEAIKGDVSPEGLCFVPASFSGSDNALLLAACEVSGTLAVYECTYPTPDTPPVHTHVCGSYEHDADNHWKVCADCGNPYDVESHTASEWIVDVEATADNDGVRHKECTVCGYVITTEDISAAGSGFDYDSWYWSVMQLYSQEYGVTASASEGGTITPAGISRIKYDRNVTYTITPDQGYAIADVLVDGKSVGAVSEYTVRHIKADHTISAVFVKTAWENPYSDVSEDAWYYEDVGFVSENAMMIGTSADGTKFSPNAVVNRAMLVTVLWRLEGSPAADSTVDFVDVPYSEWYAAAVNWAAANGIVNGCGDGVFGPMNDLTHEQIMAILNRYAVCKGWSENVSGNADDSYMSSEWAENNILWAEMSGMFDGIGSDISDLTKGADRAELAAYLRRFCERFTAE